MKLPVVLGGGTTALGDIIIPMLQLHDIHGPRYAMSEM